MIEYKISLEKNKQEEKQIKQSLCLNSQKFVFKLYLCSTHSLYTLKKDRYYTLETTLYGNKRN